MMMTVHDKLEVSRSGQDIDLEAEQTLLLITSSIISTTSHNYAQRVRSRVYAIVQVTKLLFSIRAGKAKNGNPRVSSSLARPYVAIPIAGANITGIDAESAEEVTGSNSTDFPPALPDDHDHVRVDINLEEETNSSSTSTVADAKRAKIAEIVKTKDRASLHQFGGVQGIAEALNTNLEAVIPGGEEDLLSRTAPTELVVPEKQATVALSSPGFFRFLLQHCNDVTILLLLIAAVFSIGFGMKEEGLRTGWYEGFFIMVGIIVLVFAPALRDLWLLKRPQIFKRKLVPLEQKYIEVVRGNSSEEVSISSVVVGDIVVLKTGCLVPTDGLFIRGESLVVHDGLASTVDEEAPFLFQGSTVTNGMGRMLVTSVGKDTAFSELMSLDTAGRTPDKRRRTLPAQLDKLRKHTQIAGLLLSILILVVLFLRFVVRGNDGSDSDIPELKGKPTASKEIMDVIERIIMKQRGKISTNIISVLTVILVGIVEGIPIVITFALVYLRKKVLSNRASDPGLLATVTMGSATTIWIDKSTLNPSDVAMCFVGTEEVIQSATLDIAKMPELVREALGHGISAPLLMPSSPRKVAQVTEDPLLPWANSNLGIKLDNLRQSSTIIKTKGLSSNEEGSSVLMKKKKKNSETDITSLHLKGPATAILRKCSSYYNAKGETNVLDEDKRQNFERNIEMMQSKDLKTVAFACKQTHSEENDLIVIAMVGLKKNACCAEMKETLKAFQDAEVKIRLVSEDGVSELEEIATACKILPQDGLVIEGKDFREYSEQDRMDKADKIYVMGNSDPSDRLLLMQYLKQKGNVVVALGSRTNDTPMLREADLGVAMGTWSSQMARESSDLVVFDGSLSSLLIVKSCGRCTYHNIQKYIQLELVTNIAGTLIASITTMSLGSNSITGIQLLWANLVATLVAGPALLMEPPKTELMQKAPIRPTEPLISKPMWRNIVIQAIYQTTILVTFQFKGRALLGFININTQHAVSKSMTFNSFVLCQIFNQVNSRELEKINVLKGIHRNPWFSLAVVFILGLQVSFNEVAHILVGDDRLNLAQWCVCLLIGAVSCPVDSAAKCAWNLV